MEQCTRGSGSAAAGTGDGRQGRLPRSRFRSGIWGLIVLSGLGLLAMAVWGQAGLGLVEVFGFVSGAVCVMLTVEENNWNWPIGLANNLFFIALFWNQRLYADMGLQFVYIVLAVWGWYNWLHGGRGHGRLAVRRTGLAEGAVLALIAAAATAGMTVFLTAVNDAAPFLDALTTVLSLVAQYLLTRKALENWVVWMGADVLYVGLYLSRGLLLTAILYGLFLLLCVGGFRMWLAGWRTARQASAPGPGLVVPGPAAVLPDTGGRP
jgi:nicotinamide mononucleotide transporter